MKHLSSKRASRFLLVLTIPLFTLHAQAAYSSHTRTGSAAGSYETGRYQNFFTSLLSKTPSDVEKKITSAFNQLFHGDTATQAVYFPVGTDMAYIEDILHNDVRTEGMSYGMMIAVQLDKQQEFNRLWKWAKMYMQYQSGIRRHFFAWHCAVDGTKLDQNAASDGEEWFVTALFFASARWGNGSGIFDYNAEAQAILRAMVHKEDTPGGTAPVTNMFNRQERQVVFVPSVEAAGFTDPSYHLPHFYELWSRWASQDNGFWASCAHVSREFWKKAAHPVTGLAPEYAHFDGRPILPWGSDSKDFRYDAWRVAMNVAVDHEWFAGDAWEVEQSNRLLKFFHAQGVGKYGSLYKLDGRVISTGRSTGLVAMNAVASLASTLPERTAFLDELWNTPIPSGPGRYYDGLLYMLSLLQTSGNFRIYDPVKTRRHDAEDRSVIDLHAYNIDGSRSSYISTRQGAFTLSAARHTAPIVTGSSEFPGVRRVLTHLQSDLFDVTGAKPLLLIDSLPRSRSIVIAGTIGRSELIDSLIRSGKFCVDQVAGRW
ncbi:MAG TPA: glycosyl hydrolase family 8, partial [Bacteroidota bacterium]|nr:glycosyl hydrolase family 8 [Bacteroidota bacterium]